MYVTLRFFSIFMSFVIFLVSRKVELKRERTRKMKKSGKRELFTGSMFVVAFVIWTISIQVIDVQAIAPNGTEVGFATINSWFHKMTGVHLIVYMITDWLGLVPIFICMLFGGVGFVQLVKRRSLFKVDYDIILLGIYYIIVIFSYFIFEMIPINYRPILINGFLEASYPSSTTLLVLSVMPTLVFQVKRRLESVEIKKTIGVLTGVFSAFMVIGRLIAGVHWFTDIVGSVMLSEGLFYLYKAVVLLCHKKEK